VPIEAHDERQAHHQVPLLLPQNRRVPEPCNELAALELGLDLAEHLNPKVAERRVVDGDQRGGRDGGGGGGEAGLHQAGILRRGLLEPLLNALPTGNSSHLGKAQRYVRRANIPNPVRFYSYEFFVKQEASWLLAPDFLRAATMEAPERILWEHYKRAEATSELNRLLYLDMKLTIGDNDLLKVTRTAELAGIGLDLGFAHVESAPLVRSSYHAKRQVQGL